MVTDPERLQRVALDLRTASERLFLNAPVYRSLTRAIAGDAALLGLAAEARDEQPPTLMLLGAVHYLILRGASHPLAGLYQGLAEGRAPSSDPFPLFKDFCERHAEDITALLRRGRVQTNEVGRAVYLRAGLEAAAERFGGQPTAYVEIGASAGLNLSWDAFCMCLRRGERALLRGPAGSAVRLECALEGAQTPAERGVEPPPLLGRVGLEIAPPDLDDPAARDWLLAFVWAEHGDRLARLRGAMDLARQRAHPLRAVDAAEGLRSLAEELPPGQRLTVAHTFLLSQLPPPALAALEEALALASRGRELLQVGAEWVDQGTSLQLRRWEDGRCTLREDLARGDAHGRWLRWSGSSGA